MTPINSAISGGLPAYTRQDVVDASASDVPLDPARGQAVDPSQPGFVDASDTAYDAPVDTGTAPYENYGSAVAGMQPATTGAVLAATLEDFAALGIFTEQELDELARMGMSSHDLGVLYQESLAFKQSPEFAQLQAEQASASADSAPADATGDVAASTPTGEPAWNGEWAVKFRAMMDEQGLDSKTQLMVVASLRQMPLGEADLAQALEYYATSPEGKAELQLAEQQVQAGATMQNRIMLSMGLGALGVGAAAGAVGSSRGNLVKALERTAAGGGERAGVAARALDDITAGRPLTSTMRLDVERAMRAEAGATSRLRNPIAKSSLNGAARHVTPSMQLSGRDLAKYALWMKSGDVTSDAAAAAASVSRASSAAAPAAGSTAARAVAGAGDDIGRAAASGAASAATGASTLGKFGRALGPIGLIASAGFGIYGISKTMEAEGEFGKESARMTGSVAGGLAGGAAGAATGAAIGAIGGPIGAGVGAVVGGIVGGLGLGKVGEGVGGWLHDMFD